MTENISTREGWLHQAALALVPLLEEVGEEVPPLRLSVGWPGGSANRNRTIGQCWSRDSSEDGVNQIFISPIRGESSTLDVLGTLLHEMVHAIDNCKDGHKGNFARIAKALGFVGKLTQSGNRSSELDARLEEVREKVGMFPHAALVGTIAADTPKKQGTRMLKLECSEGCGYIVRTSRKWVEAGLPTCPCGGEFEEVE